jgi:hypothetical protein
LVLDDQPTYVLYGQTMGSHTQIGVIAACSVAEYDAGTIAKHEYTRPDKEDDRTQHMEVLDNQALTSGMAVLVVGHDITTFASYPLADAYEAQLVRAGVAPDRARDTATVVIALMAGWAIGQPFWLGMAGRRDDPRTVRDTIERAVWAVIDHATPVTTTINRERSTR